MKNRKGHLTQSELELMLYDINKIWREREKRIINTLNSQKAKEVDFLKRKLTLHKSNSAKEWYNGGNFIILLSYKGMNIN